MLFSLRSTLPLLALASSVLSQTFTDCDPTKKQCPPDQGLGVANYTIDFTQNMMSSTVWNATAGTVNYDSTGALFVINQRGDSPTVKSNFHLFFGQVEVIMKAAKGQGIISSIVLESDDLDEIDWETMGGNNSFVETNYFGKGNTSSYGRAIYYPVTGVTDDFHNYTVNWSAEKLEWYIDGQMVRTLNYQDANGGNNFPQTPCDVRLGIWAGGDPKEPNGTIQWAGGLTDYSQAPFTMTVKSLRVSDASRGTTYTYGDLTGDWQSIKISNSSAALKLDGSNSQSSLQSARQKWNGLSHTAKIVVAASVLGVVAICVAVFAFCCVRQRRAGKHERLIEDAKFEKETAELLAYRAEMARLRTEKLAEARAMGSTPGNLGMSPHMGAGFASPNPNAPPGGYAYSQASLRSQNSNYAQSVHSYGSRGGGGYQRL